MVFGVRSGWRIGYRKAMAESHRRKHLRVNSLRGLLPPACTVKLVSDASFFDLN